MTVMQETNDKVLPEECHAIVRDVADNGRSAIEEQVDEVIHKLHAAGVFHASAMFFVRRGIRQMVQQRRHVGTNRYTIGPKSDRQIEAVNEREELPSPYLGPPKKDRSVADSIASKTILGSFFNGTELRFLRGSDLESIATNLKSIGVASARKAAFLQMLRAYVPAAKTVEECVDESLCEQLFNEAMIATQAGTEQIDKRVDYKRSTVKHISSTGGSKPVREAAEKA